MLVKPLAFAATAAAFVIVPEISNADVTIIEGIVKALPVESESFGLPTSTQQQSVSVPCAQCKGKDAKLHMDFSVERGSRLMLNGFELYPNADPWSGDLKALMSKADGSNESKNLGYSLAIEPVAMDEYQQMSLIDVDFKIIEVGGQFVEGVPTVKVQIIQTITEDIAIGKVDVQPSSSGAECTSMWCRAQDVAGDIFSVLDGLKGGIQSGIEGCFGSGNHDMLIAEMDQTEKDGAGAVPVISGPESEEPSPSRHNWRLLVKNVASHIFLPVLMGVTAGVGVAVLAMVLCSIAIRLTKLVKTKRSRRGGCCRKKRSSRHQSVSDEEKTGLMEEGEAEEAPPVYRDEEDTRN
ncbi:hypothetical protein HIM_04795 [Hirsutella minnesotensis 3608]|uniref:DUF7728 domain-containing protein n=1 Tax=Hirsutella minnesotensis 3608 TaxID=1043627 RepID=A0A0F7ZL42_9HYPO|nr:hypothetical protein HIM_04795 [Hirsutella minnesotensis 3608]